MLQKPEWNRPPQTPMRWRMTIMLICSVAVFGGVLGWQAFGPIIVAIITGEGMGPPVMPPQIVSTVKAEAQDWQPRLHAVGTLRAANGTDVSAEVPGIVEEIRFESGDDVKAGQVLVNLRSGVDAARLREAQVAVELARVAYRRNQELAPQGLVSQAALDSAQAQLRSAEAQLAQQQEGVKRTAVRAPFGGRIGLRVVDVGQFLNAGTKIATLQELDELLADFNLPQRDLGQLSARQRVAVSADAWPGETFAGEVIAIDSKVDQQTRNVAVRARIENVSHKLLPGMYVSVEVDAGAPERRITLPQTAVVYNSFGDAVFVVEESGPAAGPGAAQLVAKQAFVKIGPTRGDQIAILDGIKEGATVVSAGQIKLQDGAAVKINNSVQPPNDPAPRPSDEPARRQ